MSKRRRYIRFSIGAMLLLMTGVAVLVNHEVQRAKAIETTVKKIQECNGKSEFRPRVNVPKFLARVLPKYWPLEIDSVSFAMYSHEDISGLEQILTLGALDNIRTAALEGHAIDYHAVSRVCRSASMEQCYLFRVSLSDNEIADLRQAYPECQFRIVQHAH